MEFILLLLISFSINESISINSRLFPFFIPVCNLVKTVESVKAFLLKLEHIVTHAGEALKGARCTVVH